MFHSRINQLFLLFALLPAWIFLTAGKSAAQNSTCRNVTESAGLPQVIKIGYLVGLRPLGLTISGAISYAIEKVNSNKTLLPNHKLELVWNDTNHSRRKSYISLTEQWAEGAVAFFGPEDTCFVEAHLAAAWDLPMISYKCSDSAVSDKEQFPTFLRTFPPDKQVTKSVIALLKYHQWNKFTIIQDNVDRWTTVANNLVEVAKTNNFTINQREHFIPNTECCMEKKSCCEPSAFTSLIEKTYTKTRVYVFLGNSNDLVKFMKAMNNKELMKNGDYIVIYVDLEYGDKDTHHFLIESADIPKEREKIQKLVNERSDNGRSLLVISHTKPSLNDNGYKSFVEKVHVYNAMPPFSFSLPSIFKNEGIRKHIPIFASYLYDSILLYAEALDDTLRENGTVKNGSLITKHIIGKRFDSITGVSIQIDNKGDAEGNFSVLAFGSTNSPSGGETGGSKGMVPVGIFLGHKDMIEFRLQQGQVIDWIAKKPPAAEPPCGFEGENCKPHPDKNREIASGVLGGLLVVVLASAITLYRNWKYEQEIAGLLWKIYIKEIQMHTNCRLSCNSKMSVTSQTSMESRMGGQVFYQTTGLYKGTIVTIKKFEFKKKIVDIPRETKIEMKLMKEIRHDNINPFIGACLEPNQVYIITEYCSKGSLQDILENENLKLEPMVISSLILDLIKGMTYLHNSDLKWHGNLKSSNCVVTSRWVLQVADFGLHDLKCQAQHSESKGEYQINFCKLWTAPEILRCPSKYPRGSQKGDVYSFAIILYEIFLGGDGPYPRSQVQNMTLEEILDSITNPSDPNEFVFRPDVSVLQCQEYIISCIQDCWQEKPELRPDFEHIRQRLKAMRQGMKPNMFDHMMAIMENYAQNLEGLVSDRTKELQEEKKLTETLLHRMLPQSVAAALVRGDDVQPEAFDAVTIYFSDIVGFTNMSAESTPMEVVTFLNELYTIFDKTISDYDVYKVETIGDAYMVVSGLPIKNGENHAGEIASMAIDLLSAVKTFKIPHRLEETLKLRIGIHTGPVVAGVVGQTMPRYCLFGDTVNTASRMESNGEALKIHISQQCREALEKLGGYIIEQRGVLSIKGKGHMTTYWLMGRTDEFSFPTKKKVPREISPLFSGGRINSMDMSQAPETLYKSCRGVGIPRAYNHSTRSIQDFGNKSRRTRNYSPVRQLSVYDSYQETEADSLPVSIHNNVVFEDSGGSGDTIPADERLVPTAETNDDVPSSNCSSGQIPPPSQPPYNKIVNNNNVNKLRQTFIIDSPVDDGPKPNGTTSESVPMTVTTSNCMEKVNCNGQIGGTHGGPLVEVESTVDETTHLLTSNEKDQLVDVEIIKSANNELYLVDENDDKGDLKKRWRSCSEINVLPPRPRPKTIKNWLTGLFNYRESLSSIPRVGVPDGESVV